MQERLRVKKGHSTALQPQQAATELAQSLQQPDMKVVIFFCSSRHDLGALGAALKENFDCPVIGCTTAGEITAESGYLNNGIVGVSLSSDELTAHPRLIHPLDKFGLVEAENLVQDLRKELKISPEFDATRMFGLLLVDGMSMLEEQVVASIYNQLGGVPIIGGSAGDDLSFKESRVFWDGAFINNAAVFTLFETTLPFKTFQTQHFEPTDTRLVITESDCATRTVKEINGESAVEEYARAVGLDVKELTPQVFAAYPVMLKIGGEYYVRSIQKANPDGSLTFYCAIDNGLVLTVAKGTALLENLRQRLEQLHDEVSNVKLVLGCDCILRRLELQQKNQIDEARAILADSEFIGFSTYGEQFNGIHVNQTLTGIALGS
ncbi:MAG: nitric oxide-sensing protein NosP [Betaproteobacteria bacterium]